MHSLRLKNKQNAVLDKIIDSIYYYDNIILDTKQEDKKLIGYIYLYELIIQLLVNTKNSRDSRYSVQFYTFYKYGTFIEKDFKENIPKDNCITNKMYKRFKIINNNYNKLYILYYTNTNPIGIKKLEEPICAICLSNISNSNSHIIVTDCNHSYHKRCLLLHLLKCTPSCPMCRKNI